MSTFDGHVIEFPDIQIDRFCRNPSRPAVAFFLSHVHSDHLVGLESFRGTFIYCSLATREILLRLEKYPHRMNFARGILESRVQTYKHLKSVLKPIPLETPTTIELSPGKSIKVTLFDANHCVGAVMFLIEGNGKAILYTGDVRSEPWWVESLTRNPIILPYVFRKGQEPIKRLDNLYLDTSFATNKDKYREFPPKADGISELLRKVARYPKDARFYFDSWTFGYEEVWQALSNLLDTQIHVDDYRFKLYSALASVNNNHDRPPEASKLVGSACGNHYQEGCLTTRQTRLHSCEFGTDCGIWKQSFVRITPIVSRYNGMEISEHGIGGGQGDLNQEHFLEFGDATSMQQLTSLCSKELKEDPKLLEQVIDLLKSTALDSTKKISIENEDHFAETSELPINSLIPTLAKKATESQPQPHQSIGPTPTQNDLPQQIRFPYSRHSSYHELCLLVNLFRPLDIHPCTVDRAEWNPTHSMIHLFGHLYHPRHIFRHDQMMLTTMTTSASDVGPDRSTKKRQRSSDTPTEVDDLHEPLPLSSRESDRGEAQSMAAAAVAAAASATASATPTGKIPNEQPQTGAYSGSVVSSSDSVNTRLTGQEKQVEEDPRDTSTPGHRRRSFSRRSANDEARLRKVLRRDAYDAALGEAGATWFDIGLVSVRGHQDEEMEL